MSFRPSGLLNRALLAAFTVAISAGIVVAQDASGTATTSNTSGAQTAPAGNRGFTSDEYVPNKWEFFGGYSWIAPNGSVGGVPLDKHITPGFALSGAYYVNRYLGGEVLGSYHSGDREKISSITAGPIVRYPIAGLSPFIHATIGGNRLSPDGLSGNWGFGTALGGGLDLAIPALTHFKIRVIQADYLYSHHNFFPILPRTNMGSAQLSAGIVYTAVPLTPPVPPTLACAVNPAEVFPGEPIAVTVTPSNFNPKRTITYTYQANGGKVTGTGPTATIDTTGANAGSYNVTATATDGHMKVPVSCTAATYSVKEWPGPQVTCSANPTDIDPGQTSAITANGSSVKGDVKYSYTATGGTVEGNGPNATLSGAQPGTTATVTCTVTDDRGKTASAQTSVNVRQPVAPPPPPPPPSASKINEIAFTKPYSSRVDNTAKAILDDVALRLQREPDSKAVVVGETDASETNAKRGKNLAALRAVNTKAYLVNEKGIDPSRIETRTDGTAGMKSEIWIVPNGATFNQPDTTVTDLAAPAPKAVRHRRHRAAKAAPAQ